MRAHKRYQRFRITFDVAHAHSSKLYRNIHSSGSLPQWEGRSQLTDRCIHKIAYSSDAMTDPSLHACSSNPRAAASVNDYRSSKYVHVTITLCTTDILHDPVATFQRFFYTALNNVSLHLLSMIIYRIHIRYHRLPNRWSLLLSVLRNVFVHSIRPVLHRHSPVSFPWPP